MGDTFQGLYEAAAAQLLGTLPNNCGISAKLIATSEQQFGISLPTALRDYYIGIENLPLNIAHNRLLAPEDWFIDDGKLVFMEENQRVVFWGVEATEFPDSDPAVFQCVNLPESPEWYQEQDRCSEFLLLTLHYQAAMGGFQWGATTRVDRKKIDHFNRNWFRVGESKNDLLAFRREGQVACLLEDGKADTLQLLVSGRTQEEFREIAAELRVAGIGIHEL